MRMKSLQVKLQSTAEKLTAKLLIVKEAEGEKDDKPKKAGLLSKGSVVGPSETHLEVLNEAVMNTCTTFLDEHPGITIKEGFVEVEKDKKRVSKKWMVLSSTHLEFKDAADSKSSSRSISLLACVASRIPPHRASQHLLELITLQDPVAINVDDSEQADAWLLAILQARCDCIARLMDSCSGFRNLVSTRAGTTTLTAASSSSSDSHQQHHHTHRHGDRSTLMTATGAPLVGREMLKFAFLEYERVAMGYEMALSLHDTYVSDVEKRLARLDSLDSQRRDLRKDISTMEAALAAEERQAQTAGKSLSETFGVVLESVGIVHESLTGMHEHLKAVAATDAVLSKPELVKVNDFRRALNMLDVGLALDVPLKHQLRELEYRETQAVSEVDQLEQRKKQLETVLSSAKEKREELEDLKRNAGSLKDALAEASGAVVKTNKELLEASDIVVMYGTNVLDASRQLHGLERRSIFAPVKTEAVLGGVSEFLGSEGLPHDSDGPGNGSADEELAAASPEGLVYRVLQRSARDLETAIIRCMEYFAKPVHFLEQITLCYCEGPSVFDTEERALDVEKTMAVIRLRALNMLRKWVRTHPYHFSENEQMGKLLSNFLSCVRLTGNEKLANLIESDLAAELASATVTFAPLVSPPLNRPNIPVEDVARLVDAEPEELARQLSLQDQEMYRSVQVRELIKTHFMSKKAAELAPNVKRFTERFNRTAAVVSSSILALGNAEDRASMIEFWVNVLRALRVLRNYQSLLAVTAGLSGTPINRLKNTWAMVKPESVTVFEDCSGLMEKNFSRLRSELESSMRPVIPYLGAFQRDLVYLEESPTMKGEEVNLHKLKSISGVIQNCIQHKAGLYNWFEPVPSIVRVLQSQPVYNEEEAHRRSLEVEPKVSKPVDEPAKKNAPMIPIISFSREKGKESPKTSPRSGNASPNPSPGRSPGLRRLSGVHEDLSPGSEDAKAGSGKLEVKRTSMFKTKSPSTSPNPKRKDQDL